jgi:hypothetical protein
MSDPSELWFILVEADGQPYEETSADIVSLLPSQRIVNLRDAAHAKNSSILTGITPSQLKVYKNKAVFDKREEENHEPLQLILPLNSLGNTEDDPLVILVPGSTHRAIGAGANCVFEYGQQKKLGWHTSIVCVLSKSGLATVSFVCTILQII